MSIPEYSNLGSWLIHLLVYGTLLIIALGFFVVFLKSFRANLRTRGIVGILIAAIKLVIFAGLVLILIHFAKENEWMDKLEAMLP